MSAPLEKRLDGNRPSETLKCLKGLTHRDAIGTADQIRAVLGHADPRIGLEAAAAIARRDEAAGLAVLSEALNGTGNNTPWALEAAFILAELRTPNALVLLRAGSLNSNSTRTPRFCDVPGLKAARGPIASEDRRCIH